MPTPRGIGDSRGPMSGIGLADLAEDVAEVIRQDQGGRQGRAEPKAVVAGHAFGNWIARMAAACHPDLVRGVILLAAAHRDFPARLRDSIDRIMDTTRPAADRIADLQEAFFAPGHEAQGWLEGWHPQVARRAAPGCARDCHGKPGGPRAAYPCWTCRPAMTRSHRAAAQTCCATNSERGSASK